MKPTPDTIASLPCEVQLPDTWVEGTDTGASFIAVHEELRRCRRAVFCSSAALGYRQSFPSMRRPSTWHRVFTINLARGGIAFLHGEPLFPRERADIVLLDGNDYEIEIVRCRRIQERCFEIASRFIAVCGTVNDPVGPAAQSG